MAIMEDPLIVDRGYRPYPKEEDIPKYQKQIFEASELTTEYTVDDIRKMAIWVVSAWKNYYVVYANVYGKTAMEDYTAPDGMKTFFIHRKDGTVRIATKQFAVAYFDKRVRDVVPVKAMDKVPFNNLEIG